MVEGEELSHKPFLARLSREEGPKDRDIREFEQSKENFLPQLLHCQVLKEELHRFLPVVAQGVKSDGVCSGLGFNV